MAKVAHPLRVSNIPVEDTWKDIVRIKNVYRTDYRGKHVPRGSLCRIEVNGSSKWVVIRGLQPDEPDIEMDLTTRLFLGLRVGQTYDFTIYRLWWPQRLWFPWRASDPIYRLPAQLGLISLILGTSLGLLGVLLGVEPLVEKYYPDLFPPPTHQSSTPSTAPKPAPPAPAGYRP
jgi:hypothetical protein